MNSTGLVRPLDLNRLPGVHAVVSTAEGRSAERPLAGNLSYRVGDDPAQVRKNRDALFALIGATEDVLATPDQVHSASIRWVDQPGRHEECDGLMTRTPGLALGVTIADCVPVLLADPVRGVVAAVHAGWRGSAERIVQKAVAEMVSTAGSDPHEIRAYIGHAAGACCYEVGGEVADRFHDGVRHVRQGRIFLDLKAENRNQLLAGGLRESHITLGPECTICSPRLHSYRRDGARSGRMMAVILRRER